MSINFPNISNIINGHGHCHDEVFTNVVIDSRRVQPGDLFVAIKGERFDGHHFINEAIAKGAKAIICNESIENHPCIVVPDTLKALGHLASHHRHQHHLEITALTGSCGKTSTKEMLASILSQKGLTLRTEGNLNNHIGVPLTLFKLTDKHQYGVIELGANAPGEIQYTSRLTMPSTSLITNIAPAHVEGFGSIEGVAKAKSEIFEPIDQNGLAVVHIEAYEKFKAIRNASTHLNLVTFGFSQNADIQATHIKQSDDHSRFTLITPNGDVSIHCPIPGLHHILNVLAAAACLYQNTELELIKSGIKAILPVKGRMNLRTPCKGITIIDDTYNANPQSTKAALDYLSSLKGTKIFVFGDMGELGDQAEKYHVEIGEYAKNLGIDNLYTYGSLSSITAKSYGTKNHFNDRQLLNEALLGELPAQANILFKGSRFTKLETCVAMLCEKISL